MIYTLPSRRGESGPPPLLLLRRLLRLRPRRFAGSTGRFRGRLRLRLRWSGGVPRRRGASERGEERRGVPLLLPRGTAAAQPENVLRTPLRGGTPPESGPLTGGVGSPLLLPRGTAAAQPENILRTPLRGSTPP